MPEMPFVKEMAAGPGGIIYALNEQNHIFKFTHSAPMNYMEHDHMRQPDQTMQSYPTDPQGHPIQPDPTLTQHQVVPVQIVPVQPVGCAGAVPMNDGDFATLLSTISSQSFDDGKLSTAKEATRVNCLSTNQIGQIMGTQSFEDNKLAFAKFAYEHCTDPQRYYLLNSQFSFSSNSEALSNFVQSKQQHR